MTFPEILIFDTLCIYQWLYLHKKHSVIFSILISQTKRPSGLEKSTPTVQETGFSRHIGDPVMNSLKPLNAIVLWWFEWCQGRSSIGPTWCRKSPVSLLFFPVWGPCIFLVLIKLLLAKPFPDYCLQFFTQEKYISDSFKIERNMIVVTVFYF